MRFRTWGLWGLMAGTILTIGAFEIRAPHRPVGVLATRSTLVWSGEGDVTSGVIKAWDMRPELGRDFSFTPDEPVGLSDLTNPLGIAGTGRLEWRDGGSADYDATAKHTVYVGRLVDGRPEGLGIETTRSGYRYEGAWKAGLQHGEGELRLPEGAIYTGTFAEGRFQGRGRYASPDGQILDGQFENGIFVEGTAQLDRSAESAKARAAQEVAFTVYTDRQRYQSEAENSLGGLVGYDHNFVNGLVDITLADDEILGAWKRGGPSTDLAAQEYAMWPLLLVADVTNRSGTSISITRGFLEVVRSYADLQPLLVVTTQLSPPAGCGSLADIAIRDPIHIDNYGWGNVANAATVFRFGHAETAARTDAFRAELGAFDAFATVDVFPTLQDLGVRQERLTVDERTCPSYEAMDDCLRQLVSEGIFGRLSAYVYADADRVVTNAYGQLEYEWVDAFGARQRGRMPYRVELPLFKFRIPDAAECGAGAPVAYAGRRIDLPVTGEAYRAYFDIPQAARVLRAQQNARIGIEIDSNQSAVHEFRVVFELSDGTLLRSQPLRANIFQWRLEKAYAPGEHLRPYVER